MSNPQNRVLGCMDMRSSMLGVNEGRGETGRLEQSATGGWREKGQGLVATGSTWVFIHCAKKSLC